MIKRVASFSPKTFEFGEVASEAAFSKKAEATREAGGFPEWRGDWTGPCFLTIVRLA